MTIFRRLVWLFFFALWFVPAAAQVDDRCPAIVQQALESTTQVCEGLVRNQVCYGHVVLGATLRTNSDDFTFIQPGDVVNVDNVQSLRLFPLQTTSATWGVALMNLQASLPDTLPGQNVAFVLFGDVTLDNAVPSNSEPIAVQVTALASAVVRAGPSESESIVESPPPGQALSANGVTQDSAWIRIVLPDGSTGWISAQVVTGDMSTLGVVEPESIEAGALHPMQAFYFQTGIGDAPCAGAPDSGILIQTPQGVGQVEFTANDVTIQLGSTAYFQAQPGQNMTVSVLDGQAQVESLGTAVSVPAGSSVQIPLDDERHAVGAPGSPTPFDAASLQYLPLDLLPEAIGSQQETWGVGQTVCVAIASGAWLRADPDSASQDIIEVLPQDAIVVTTGEANFDGAQWWWPVQVRDSSNAGWIEQSSLTLCTPPTPSASTWVAGQTLCVNNTNGAWLRETPDSSSQEIVQALSSGAVVTALASPIYDDVQWWWQVRTLDGRSTGWVEQNSLRACTLPTAAPTRVNPPPAVPSATPIATSTAIPTQGSGSCQFRQCITIPPNFGIIIPTNAPPPIG